jgi:hypothetical protein
MIGSFQYFRFSFREVAPTMNEVLKYVQSTGLDKEHPAVVFTENVLKKLDNLQGICGGYVIKKNEPVLPTEGVIKIDDFTLHVGKQISKCLEEASYIALFLCTAGPDFSNITRKLNHEGSWMESYLVDAIGSLTVEKAMNIIWHIIFNVYIIPLEMSADRPFSQSPQRFRLHIVKQFHFIAI